MEKTKIEILKYNVREALYTLLKDGLSHYSTVDLVECITDMQFGGIKGIDDMCNKELLEMIKDELANHEDDEYEEIRTLVAEFEMELVFEKELLT